MGPLPFQPFFPLAPAYRCVGVIILNSPIDAVFRSDFCRPNAPLTVVDIDLLVKRLIMLEHAVDDPQDLMHADTQSSHIVFPLLPVFLINLTDQRVVLNGRQSDHVQNLSRCFATLFAHFYAADAIAADLVNRMNPKKRSQFFYIGKSLDRLYLDDQPDGGRIADARKTFEQFDFRQIALIDQLLCLIRNGFFQVEDLAGCGDDELFGCRIGGRCNRAFCLGDKLLSPLLRSHMEFWLRF